MHHKTDATLNDTLIETRKAADASTIATNIAREAAVAAQRPWLSVELSIEGPFEYEADGDGVIMIGVELKNVGHTPALNARIFMEMGPFSCQQQRTRQTRMFGETVFPGAVVR